MRSRLGWTSQDVEGPVMTVKEPSKLKRGNNRVPTENSTDLKSKNRTKLRLISFSRQRSASIMPSNASHKIQQGDFEPLLSFSLSRTQTGQSTSASEKERRIGTPGITQGDWKRKEMLLLQCFLLEPVPQ